MESIDKRLMALRPRPAVPTWDYKAAFRAREQQEKDAEMRCLEWACLHCGAPAGQPCTTGSGVVKRAHAIRRLPQQEQEARKLADHAVVAAAKASMGLRCAERELERVLKQTRDLRMELRSGRKEIQGLREHMEGAAARLLKRADDILIAAEGVDAAAVMVDLAREIRLQRREMPEPARPSIIDGLV